jgi:hypothetical protein
MTNEAGIKYLNFLVRTYAGITQLIASTKQRLQSLPGEERNEEFDTLLKGQDKTEGLETVKGRITREIEKELKQWDVWETWAKKISGIGPFIAAQMIILFYYRFIPVCKDCGGKLEKKEKQTETGKTIKTLACVDCKKVAKEGLLVHRLEYKDFPTISKWWAYMGRHTIDGVMPKRKKGVLSNWSTVGRTLGFHIGDQFNRQQDDHPYKALLLLRKAKHAKNHPEWSKGHVHNAAKNEVVKIFLAHWWTVARTLDGKPVSEPYAGALMGHTNIIQPFYWEEESEKPFKIQVNNASEEAHKTHYRLASPPNIEARP